MPPTNPTSIAAESVRLVLQNVRFGPGLVVDEVHLESGEISVEPPSSAGQLPRVSGGETRGRILITEPNLNRLLTVEQASVPIRNLRIAVLTGRVRVSGQKSVLGLGVPFSAEAIPRIENGVRPYLDWQTMNAAGLGLPSAVVELLEQQINSRIAIDLSRLSIPLWLDEIRCEPGRITVIGKVRLAWPPQDSIASMAALRGQVQGSAGPVTASTPPAGAPLLRLPSDGADGSV